MLHNICRPGASAWTNIHRRLWPPFCYTINRKQGYNARHTLSCIPLHILKFILFRSKDLLNLRHCEEWGEKQNEEKLFVDGFGRNGKKRVQCDDIEILKELLFCLERKNSVIQLTHNRVTWLKNYKASQEKKRGKRLFRQILTKDSIRESSVQRI